MSTTLWNEHGGSGTRTILLLHGLGATAAVWQGLGAVLHARALGHWIAPDLRGHGSSAWGRHYSVGELAADLVPLVRDASELYVVGHSLGVYLGLALASGWYGVRVRGVLGIGPKIVWSEADLQAMGELAARPVRWYPQQQEALARYRRMSGLDVAIAPDAALLARGVVREQHRFRLAQDPRSFEIGGAPFASLTASATAPLLLARGEHDPMVSLDCLRAHCGDARELAGAGHNVHVEHPDTVAGLLQELFARG